MAKIFSRKTGKFEEVSEAAKKSAYQQMEGVLMLKGDDGVGISGIRQDGEEVVVTLTSGKENRFPLPGAVKGDPGTGIARVRSEDGAMIISLEDGREFVVSLPAGAPGPAGIGIAEVLQRADGEVVVRMTDGRESLLRLPAGRDGRELELRAAAGAIEMRYAGEHIWRHLLRIPRGGKAMGGGAHYLRDLGDVGLEAPPVEGDVMSFTNGKWRPVANPPVVFPAPDIQILTETGLWVKPAGAVRSHVRLVGGGQAGGSGRKGAAGTARFGGGGGAPGAYTEWTFEAAQLGDTEHVVIGAGGLGALGNSVNDRNGSAGDDGGDTLFGGETIETAKLVARGGTQGGAGGGTSASPIGTIVMSNGTQFFPGAGTATSGAAGVSAGKGAAGPTGGGGGGGCPVNNTSTSGGSSRTAKWPLFGGVSDIGAAGGAATNDGEDGEDGETWPSAHWFGSGGGGGGNKTSASFGSDAGNGGKGGFPGGGGGGGGAAENDTGASGMGGDGGDGLAIIITEVV